MVKKTDILLEQFYSTLEAQLEQSFSSSNHKKAMSIRALLNEEERSWESAYKAEQLLCEIVPPALLDIELIKRNAELGKNADSFVDVVLNSSLRQQGHALSEKHKRGALLRIINDLQWIAQKKQDAWASRRKAVKIILTVVVISLLLSVAIAGVIIFSDFDNGLPFIDKIYLLLLTVLTGCMGAAFAILIRIYRGFDERDLRSIRTASNLSFIISRISIGGVAAFIGFLVQYTGLISFEKLMPDTSVFSQTALAMLAGTLFGFSEALIPNILSKLDKKKAKIK